MMWPRTRGITTNGAPSHCGSVTSSGDAIGDAGRRGRQLRDGLLREVVVAKCADRRRREAHDELVGLLAALVAARPREVDEHRLARLPDGRMLGVEHAHVVRTGARRAIQRASAVADDQRIAMCQERHAEPLAYSYIHDRSCKARPESSHDRPRTARAARRAARPPDRRHVRDGLAVGSILDREDLRDGRPRATARSRSASGSASTRTAA